MNELDFGAVVRGQYLEWLLAGGAIALSLFLLSLFCGFVLALLLIGVRSLPGRLWNAVVAGFVAYHRNVPTLVQLFVWYFGAPQLLPAAIGAWINDRNGEFLFALIALSLNAAAYLSEDLRSGVRATARGQLEAARALGLSYAQAMRHVVLPQAIRIAVPALINQSLILFKTTSLAMAIGVAEMTYASRQIENETYRTFETFTIATAFYMVVSFAIMLTGYWYGRRHAAR